MKGEGGHEGGRERRRKRGREGGREGRREGIGSLRVVFQTTCAVQL